MSNHGSRNRSRSNNSIFGRRLVGNFFSVGCVFHNLLHQVSSSFPNQCTRLSFSPGTSCSTDSMNVGFDLIRHFKVDDGFYTADIKTSCGKIGCQEDFHLTLSEFFQGFESLRLGQISVELGTLNSAETTKNHHAMGLCLGIEKDNGLRGKGSRQQGYEHRLAIDALVSGSNANEFLLQAWSNLQVFLPGYFVSNANSDGSLQTEFDQIIDLCVHSGTKQQSLSVNGAGLDQFADLVLEPQIQKPICLVQH
mmetsp:Transcript_5841/g.14066  ORF Transcript_5841/g.14066 Transcript_5841/m.14066 type:complete len:251 (-) Transcript_5841:1182-1934(-)